MGSLLFDLRFALRQLRKSPGFAATAIAMLAFGIGATTAVFSIVEGVLLRPLPFPDSSRLMVITDRIQGADVGGNGEAGVTAPDIKAYTRDTHSFTSLGGYGSTGYELSGVGQPAQVNAARISSGVFPALGVAPLIGRTFSTEEEAQKQQLALLSYATWKDRFQGNPEVVGSKILLDRKPYVVIGVMPRNFEFPLMAGHLNRSELWIPMSVTELELTQGAASWNFGMVGRLRAGVTPAQAQNDAQRVAVEIMRSYPAFMASLRISPVVRPLQEETVETARPLVRTLFLAVAFVLLIACVNLAGLLLVRAISKQREMAVRQALGAPASVLLWQAFLESLVLSVSGGVLGVALAGAALRAGKSLLPESLPRIDEIQLNWAVIGFALLLGLVTGVVCGLAPAFASLRTGVNATLKDGGGRSGSAGGRHARLRSVLVIAEIAIALVLVAASGLLLRSFEKMRSVDLGFTAENVTSALYGLPRQQYATQAAVDSFNKELLARLQQIPGAVSAGLTNYLPVSGQNSNQTFVVEGYVPAKGAGLNLATPVQVIGDYFRTMNMRLLKGRFFTESDKADSQLVIIVSRNFAQHYWPNQNLLGKRLRIGTPEMQTPWLTVVGEIADVKLGSPDLNAQEQYYGPAAQAEATIGSLGTPADINGSSNYVVFRSTLPPERMENALRATVRSIDRQLPLTQVTTMQQAISDSEAPRRFNTAVITGFAGAAVLLAVLGIYSVIAFSVASRVQEMAIRMALGSQRSSIVRLVLVSGVKLAGAGCAIGILGAVAASGLLRSFLFAVSPFDPVVLTLAAVTVLGLALLASALPARRAASIDPMRALRTE